jgi:hypothetical protein
VFKPSPHTTVATPRSRVYPGKPVVVASRAKSSVTDRTPRKTPLKFSLQLLPVTVTSDSDHSTASDDDEVFQKSVCHGAGDDFTFRE